MADDPCQRRLSGSSSDKATVSGEAPAPAAASGQRPLLRDGHDAPTTNLLAPGQLLAGQYRVLEKLGTGGMGLVYKVLDERLHRAFAIKVLPPDMAKNENAVKRLTKEAQAAIDLHHPNIMGLNTLLVDGDTHFLVMEYLDGQDLDAALVARGALPLDEVLDIARQICPALDYAHARGVIHRDLKPANLLFKAEGGRRVVKVGDFGIAHQVRASLSQLTGLDTNAGTLLYMPPEQVAGKDLDGRSDEYALAATLYELLRGRPPFQGAGAVLIHQIETVAPDPLPDVPAHVNAALLRALSKAPADRFADCAAFLAALEGSSPATPARLAAPTTAVVTGELTGTRPAPLARRFLALAIDWFLVCLASALALRIFLASSQGTDWAERGLPWLSGLLTTLFLMRDGFPGLAASPGKALLGCRVATLQGSRPSALRSWLRNLFPFGLSYFWTAAVDAATGMVSLAGLIAVWGTVALIEVGTAACSGGRRVGDLLAGTRVVAVGLAGPSEEAAPRPLPTPEVSLRRVVVALVLVALVGLGALAALVLDLGVLPQLVAPGAAPSAPTP